MARLLAVPVGLLVLSSLLGLSPAARALPVDSLEITPFGKVSLYRQTALPSRVVIFVSGDGGWNQGVVDMARTLSEMDALVIGVDIVHTLRALQTSGERCLYPAADFENLSKAVQQHYGFPDYRTPILIGYSSGATLVYATLCQAPSTTFRGGISLGFCPDLEVTRPFCKGSGLTYRPLPRGNGWWFEPDPNLDVPWIALQGMIDQVCFPESTITFVHKVRGAEVVTLPKVGHGYAVYANWMPQFKEAFRKVSDSTSTQAAAVAVPDLPDLPLEVVPASGPENDALGFLITGDGGWGVTDKGVSRALAEHGIPVVALNSLHYFWTARTPETTADDAARVLRHFLALWKKQSVILIGYSFGADALPFVINRLPDDLKTKIRQVEFLGLSDKADFHFRVTNWLGGGHGGRPTLPELEKLRGMRMTCYYGKEDTDTICPRLPPGLMTSVELSGGHRIGSDYDAIVQRILAADSTEAPSR